MKLRRPRMPLTGILAPVILLVLLSGCKRDIPDSIGPKATASFTVTPIAGRTNTYLLTSTSENAFRYLWNKDGGGFEEGTAIDTAYYLLKGTYEVKLYAFGRGGYDSAVQTITVDEDDLTPTLNNPIFQMLTGTNWKLDPTPGTNPIIVGTENNPAEYFGGGALADCQMDDVYTFRFVNNSFRLTYDANGSTFNGGNVAPNFNCGSDRSYVDRPFTFSTTVAGAGIATITLPGVNPPDAFIGVTDVSSNNYRIISITPTTMTLRSGTTSQAVHQMKFVAE